MRSLIQRLRTGLPPASGEHSDERLLADFLAHRAAGPAFPQVAEDAFAAIVRRHGPMVRGVCRRVLRNDADADDAFQAVFVVLLRKAEAVRPRNQLGNWLYGVAVNVARRGRDSNARRRTQELITDVPGRESEAAAEQSDLRAVIDQELNGLPDAYRAAVVACDLEGHTRSEAAGRLGWSEGTVASRLARGRALLADRLTRRGIAIPAVGLAAALGGSTAEALPTVNFSLLVSSPSPAVEALAKEAIRAMTTSKLKTVAVALLALVGLTGVGAATVWACGGYGWFPRPHPPVSEAKPIPLGSSESNEPKPEPNPAVWEKPIPKETVEAGTERPTGEGVAGIAKPANFVMQNPAKDITVISDRHEQFVEFFKRQPVMIAVVPVNVRNKLIYDAKGPNGLVFVENASFNVDGLRVAAYGASVKLAPLSFLGPAYRLLDSTDAKHPVIFVRDPADANLWHAVGFTTRSSVGFFASKDRVKPDDFAPADLIHYEKPQKGTVPTEPPGIKPTQLTNPASDITVISDRNETVPEFFRRQRVIIGAIDAKTIALLAAGKGTPGKVFVGGTRTNDGEVFFGSQAEIAAPPAAVAELIAAQGKDARRLVVFFLPDARYADVYHPVGFTTRDLAFFFEGRKGVGDDFTPADLKYAGNVGKAPLPPAKQFTLTNAAKDITVLSDRDETLQAFFQRQSVVVGSLHAETLKTFTQQGFDPHERQRESVIRNPSYNDRPFPGQTIVGFRVMLPTGRMRHLLSERLDAGSDQPFAILVPDAERGTYQLVGFTDRKSVPFFADTKKAPGDDFAPADLVKTLK